jgi:hypothetical protein
MRLTTVRVGTMAVREIGCEDGRWIELAQDLVEWWPFALAVLNFGFC